MKKILDCGTFAQKLRIGNDVELQLIGIVDGKMTPQAARGLDGYGAFFNDQTIATRVGGNQPSHGFNRGEVRFTVFQRRGADTNENRMPILNRFRRPGKAKPAGGDVSPYDVVQMGLEEGKGAFMETGKFP